VANHNTPDDSCKDSTFRESRHKGLGDGSSHLASTLAILAAVIFTLASAATNLIYGIGKGVDLPTSIVWGSVAVAASIGLALAPAAFLLSLSAKRYTAAVIALVAILVFGAYSVTAALGSASGGRMVAATEASEITNARARHQLAYNTANDELATLPTTRSAGELQAQIASIDQLPGIMIDGVPCGGTLNGKVTKEWCPKRSELAAEAGRAERREKLQADMDRATAELAKLPAPKVVNTDATTLAGYLTAVGHPLSTDALNRLLVILAVLVIEFGGGLSLALATTLRADSAEVSGPIVETAPGQEVSAPAETPVVKGKSVSATPVKKRRKRARKTDKGGKGGPGSGGQRMPANVVELLKARGGRIEGGQRGIGKLLGVGKSRANELLHELAAAGAVILSTSKSGTSVQLAAA
jgi:hypothetical protein